MSDGLSVNTESLETIIDKLNKVNVDLEETIIPNCNSVLSYLTDVGLCVELDYKITKRIKDLNIDVKKCNSSINNFLNNVIDTELELNNAIKGLPHSSSNIKTVLHDGDLL